MVTHQKYAEEFRWDFLLGSLDNYIIKPFFVKE